MTLFTQGEQDQQRQLRIVGRRRNTTEEDDRESEQESEDEADYEEEGPEVHENKDEIEEE